MYTINVLSAAGTKISPYHKLATVIYCNYYYTVKSSPYSFNAIYVSAKPLIIPCMYNKESKVPYILLKALPPACMKYTARGESRVANIARGKAECYICH